MFKYLCSSALALSVLLALKLAAGQAPSKPPDIGLSAKSADQKAAESKPVDGNSDYSKEAFVDEDDITKIVFENDGTSTRETSTRIRVQSDAAIQRFGILTFPYQSAIESIEIKYVRVRKPDGTVVDTPTDTAQDMPSEITRQAPFYSDLHEKHVAVKGLGVGDRLEYAAQFKVTKPLAPGQFWATFNFSHDFIVLHEEVQVSAPRDRAVKWKSPTVKPVINEVGGRRVFTWTSSRLEPRTADEEKRDTEQRVYQTARGELPPADIELSTFATWEEVGAWYNKLQLDRVTPSADIRAKAAELTKNATDDNAKLHAIYDYVGTQFRYIGVAFGIGRYQPHSAAEILANQYGDCKDKHTLLASLLDASGIKAYPALISTFHALDLDVPSPAQFDHVITAVPRGKGFLWLDTTAEVARFGYLVSVLRNKPALVIPPDQNASIVRSAPEAPFPGTQTFKIEAKLDQDGTLKGTVDRSIGGDDIEILLRNAFRRTPLTQWKELAQQLSYNSGFSGDVSDVTASSPEKTAEPFHWSYKYDRKDFPQWSDRRITSPLPPAIGLAPDEKPTYPILLGAIGEIRYQSRVELPEGYKPILPSPIHLKEDFAEYDAVYSISGDPLKVKLQTARTLIVKMHEVPPNEYEAFKRFAKKVNEDHDGYVELSSDEPPSDSPQKGIADLPDTEKLEARQAFYNAVSEMRNGNPSKALDALDVALKADPKYARAWMLMAAIYASTGKHEKAVDVLRQANDALPDQPAIHKAFVSVLMKDRRYDDAVSALQSITKTDPSNLDAFSQLGTALFALKRYPEAAAALEAAVKLAPDRAALREELGQVYLEADDEPNALASFKKALELAPTPITYNEVAYALADAGKQLPISLEYAQRAVEDEEEASAKLDLDDLHKEDLQVPNALAAYWDTLGWLYFRMAAYDKAEKYLNAAWVLSQGPIEADHLGQVYEKENKKAKAEHMYRLSLYRMGLSKQAPADVVAETRSRLERLNQGASADTTNLVKLADELSEMRVSPMPRLVPGTDNAEFFLTFVLDAGPQGYKVENVKFVSGSKDLKSAINAIRSAKFAISFPDDGPTRLLRRGTLSCYAHSGCSFALANPDLVTSID